MSDAQRIHPTTPPPACSACYQHSDRQHVDFGAAYDGPVVPGQTDVALVTTVSIDDLIICEDCLGTAARHLGYTLDEEKEAQITSLQQQNTDLRERVAAAVEYIKKLDAEMEQRANLEDLLAPPKKTTKEAARA